MKSIKGIIIIVQEGRFQLMDQSGVAHHFLLGHAAAAEPEQLAPLQHEQALVQVHYKDPKDVIGHTAMKITVLDSMGS